MLVQLLSTATLYKLDLAGGPSRVMPSGLRPWRAVNSAGTTSAPRAGGWITTLRLRPASLPQCSRPLRARRCAMALRPPLTAAARAASTTMGRGRRDGAPRSNIGISPLTIALLLNLTETTQPQTTARTILLTILIQAIPAVTDDTLPPLCFPAVGRKKITAAFDGGRITSVGGTSPALPK